MKLFFTILFIAACTLSLLAQKPSDVLATATGLTFTPAALSDNGQKLYFGESKLIASERSRLESEMIVQRLIETDAAARGISSEGLIDAELKAVPQPTETEIKRVFDANLQNFAGRSIDDVRAQIVAFLRQNAEQKVMSALVERLKAKYKFAQGKDINAADLKPLEAIFSIGGKPVSAEAFDERYKADIYDLRAQISDALIDDLKAGVFSGLVNQEAKTRGIASGDLIAAEVTNKLHEFSDEERARVEQTFRETLFKKYKVKLTVREPEPVAHAVSVDDDPFTGSTTAPVTVVMFSDFQCPSCSATHPVLQKVLAEYGDNIRFVVRDFPLESIHEHAFHAALAANAARAQGKFFEYTDILYKNQYKLDDASLKKYATSLGLNLKQFELDFNSEKTAAEIRKDMADGREYGVGGTPTIYVNGVKVNRLSAEAFRAAIDGALTRTAAK